MWISKRTLLLVMVAGIVSLSMALAAGAFGKDGDGHHGNHGKPLIDESLAPSQLTDPDFHGVAHGGAPWVLKRGNVQLKRNGRLELSVKGLVIPALGTPGPVNTIEASLFCGTDTVAADTSQQAPISRSGNARIRDNSFNVPATCLAPVILVHPNTDLMHYIAVDGWRL